MTFRERVAMLRVAKAQMESSKELCLDQAEVWFARGEMIYVLSWLERACQYAWGFWRPEGWGEAFPLPVLPVYEGCEWCGDAEAAHYPWECSERPVLSE